MVGAPSTILLVEDDPGDVLLVRETLSEAAPELELRDVGTLAAALDVLPDGVGCALLDLGLPDSVGLDAVRAVRARAPEVAIVVLTGRADESTGIEALGAGAQDYLVKGQVEADMLARAIRYAIERRRAELADYELIEARLQARENARLERGLLPTALIADPRMRIASAYRPGRRRALLGGDFYDAVELGDGSIHAMIGDVCGHGPDEAALGACLRAAWRALALAPHPPEEVMATLHRMLPHERHDEDVFATLSAVAIAPDRRSATIRLAGHQPPVLIDPTGARILEAPASAPPLGIFEQSDWPAYTVELPERWSLLLYTDGLIEGRAGDGHERVGERRLVEMIDRHRGTAGGSRAEGEQLLEQLIAEVEELNGEPLTDDLAIVMLSAGEAG